MVRFEFKLICFIKGDPSLILPTVWPELPDSGNTNETQKLFSKFTSVYRAHYDEIVNALGSLQFSSVELIWQQFWQCAETSDNKEGTFIYYFVILII